MRKALTLGLLVFMMFIANVALAGPPTDLAATAVSDSKIDLSWTDSNTWEDGYHIERDGVPIKDVLKDVDYPDGGTVTYSDIELSEYTTYTYRVRAFKGTTSGGYSNEDSATTQISPPSNLVATAISSSQIDITWTDNSDVEEGFKIERDSVEIDTVPAGTTTYNDIGLDAETEYTYRVRAYKGEDESDYSNEDSATTLPADVEQPTIVGHDPPDGSILDIEPQTVTITFDEAMNTESILKNSTFKRINVTDDVTEMEASFCTFLQWFGFTDPGSVAKYESYGCTGPFGQLTEWANTVDVTFTGEHGSSVLGVTLLDLTVGEPKKPIGPKEYRISIIVNGATDLAGNPLDLEGHVDYTYYMTQVESVDAAVGGTFSLEGVVDVIIPPGAFDQNARLKIRPIYPSDTLPSFASDVMGIIPGYGKAFVLELEGIEPDPPPSTPFALPVTIRVNYDDSDIPTHPGEKALRLYRVKDERWQPILGFQPNTVANTLDTDVTEFSTFALLNGAPYGDINGENGDGLIDIADVTILLKQIVGKAEIFNGVDPEFAKYAADVSLEIAGGEPEIPDIGDVVLILKYIVGKITTFPVEEVAAGPSLIALYPPASGDSTMFLKRSSFGNTGTVSVILDNSSDILSAEIVLIYDAKVLKFTGVSETSLATDQVMEYNAVNAGELQMVLVSAQPLNSEDSILDIQFEMAEGADKFELDSVKLAKVKLNNGLVKAKLEAFPQKLTLLQNYPNPFNPETWIPYKLNQSSDVEIRIYNISGQLVRTLYTGKQSPGNYVTKEKATYWDGRNNRGEKVTSGVYFYQLLAGKNSLVRKMVILK